MSGQRGTLITCVDIDTGESETVEIGPNQYLIVCGGDRYVANEQIHANGTAIATIKTHDGDWR